MSDNVKVLLRKIPLESILPLLEYLQTLGAEYVDIEGISYKDENIQDEIVVVVQDDYLYKSKEEEIHEEEEEGILDKFEQGMNVQLRIMSENDIDDLLNKI